MLRAWHSVVACIAGLLVASVWDGALPVGRDARPVTQTGLRFVSVSTGLNHTCGITSIGEVYCWGDGSAGQSGPTVQSQAGGMTTTPLLVGSGYSQVDAGWNFTCGVTSTGASNCWGVNLLGQLATGTVGSPSAAPSPMIGGLKFGVIQLGHEHGCGITRAVTSASTGALLQAGDKLYCWGNNSNGAVGIGNLQSPLPAPQAVIGGHAFKSVARGSADFTCAINDASDAYCWGLNSSGQLGVGSASSLRNSPSLVVGSYKYRAIGAGNGHACALAAPSITGVTSRPVGTSAYCWGHNNSGQLGIGSVTSARSTPSKVAAPSGGFFTVAAGNFSSCGITPLYALYCWGYNSHGQLGIGVVGSRPTPTPVLGGLTFASISIGYEHMCGRTTGGIVYCWGRNDRGQLGNGSTSDSYVPTKVANQ